MLGRAVLFPSCQQIDIGTVHAVMPADFPEAVPENPFFFIDPAAKATSPSAAAYKGVLKVFFE